MNEPTDWMSAILILGAGLVVGALVLYFFSRRKSRQFGDDPALALKDLEAKRDALIQQIRELDSENKLTPQQTVEARRELERQTADVLRKIDAYRGRPAKGGGKTAAALPVVANEVESTETASGMNPAIKGFLWGAVSFAVLAGLGCFVMESANPRDEGGSVTGGVASQQQQTPAAPPNDPMLKALEQAVQNDPTNLTLRNDLAQAYLERDYMMGVFDQTKIVLEKEPENSRALAYQGLVRLAMGEDEEATAMLQRSTKSDPKNLDGWVALAWVHAQRDNMDEAAKMIAEATKQSPKDKQQLEAVFAQMKTQIAQAKSQPMQAAVAGGELPPGHPPVDGSAPAAMAAQPQSNMARPAPPADGKSVRLTLNLAPGAKTSSGILFVMARQPGGGGPPVAVKRMMVTTFPVTIDFGSADSMMGQPLPDKFRLEARLDTDGDAATKPPTDPSAMQEGVAPGAVVNLALK